MRGRNVQWSLLHYLHSLFSVTANSLSPVMLQSLIHEHSPDPAVHSLLNSAVELPVSDSSPSDSSIVADSPPLPFEIPAVQLPSLVVRRHNREGVDCVERRERRELDLGRSSGQRAGRSG